MEKANIFYNFFYKISFSDFVQIVGANSSLVFTITTKLKILLLFLAPSRKKQSLMRAGSKLRRVRLENEIKN